MKQRGRPTRLNAELMRQICALLSEGISITATCDALGVTESRYFDWIKKDQKFREQATRARARGKIALVRQILADKDWRAKAWYLERCWPNEFGRTADRQLPVEKDDGKISVAIVCETGGKSLEQLLNFPRAPGTELPDAPVPNSQRPIVVAGRVVGWEDNVEDNPTR
jgi:hypothetical protein